MCANPDPADGAADQIPQMPLIGPRQIEWPVVAPCPTPKGQVRRAAFSQARGHARSDGPSAFRALDRRLGAVAEQRYRRRTSSSVTASPLLPAPRQASLHSEVSAWAHDIRGTSAPATWARPRESANHGLTQAPYSTQRLQPSPLSLLTTTGDGANTKPRNLIRPPLPQQATSVPPIEYPLLCLNGAS